MKIYKSVYRNWSVTFQVNGSRQYVHFTDRREPYFYGVFYCDNEDLAKAIESSRYFGKVITLLEDETPKEEEQPKTYAAVYEDVKRTQEANKILINNYGVDKENLTSKADALRIAEELNISFPNL